MSFSTTEKIVLASNNPGKIREIQVILQGHPIVPQSQFQLIEAEETGTTFVENAIIKARHAALHCHLPAIADDSGLVVDALKGQPGVVSARYAGANASDQDNLIKVLAQMKDIAPEQRTARFVCVMVFIQHAEDPLPVIAQGVWEGSISSQPSGHHGFGYDPIFWLSEYQKSSAELSPEAKNTISHRAQALKKLVQKIKLLSL